MAEHEDQELQRQRSGPEPVAEGEEFPPLREDQVIEEGARLDDRVQGDDSE